MCVTCFGGAGVGCEPELPNTAGNCPVGDFASQVLVAGAPGFSCCSKENVLFLSREL